MHPIQELRPPQARGITYVLMDIDDTLTRGGKLVADAYQALWDLHNAGLRCIPVTGRPAGWCDCMIRQWPVVAIIGENGALAFWEESLSPSKLKDPGNLSIQGPLVRRELFHPQAIRNDHPQIQRIRQRVIQEVPGSRIAKDQFVRLFDIAFDFAEEEPVLGLDTAQRIQAIAIEEGAMAKISSIHVNVWMGRYTKIEMACLFLEKLFGWNATQDRDQVLFVGDSPNDEPMFRFFPFTCGVANIKRYTHLMEVLPTFVTQGEGGNGFAEAARILLERRK
ncbi:MAG: HAD family phosphatase [Treponemataceae bacterium]|nr:HAD family phosphatase [Treponemataceae bacterium]